VCAPLGIPDSPEGLPKGESSYWKRKYEDVLGYARKLEAAEVGPKAAGILEPEVVQRKRSATVKRITDGHGSATLSGLLQIRREQRMAEEAEAFRKTNAAQLRAEKKAASSAEAMAQLELWRTCKDGCVCGPPGDESYSCPVGALVLCPFCDTLKKRACAVRACKEKAAAAAALAGEQGPEGGEGQSDDNDEDEGAAVGGAAALALEEHGGA